MGNPKRRVAPIDLEIHYSAFFPLLSCPLLQEQAKQHKRKSENRCRFRNIAFHSYELGSYIFVRHKVPWKYIAIAVLHCIVVPAFKEISFLPAPLDCRILMNSLNRNPVDNILQLLEAYLRRHGKSGIVLPDILFYPPDICDRTIKRLRNALLCMII
jgi:hypothetical protein